MINTRERFYLELEPPSEELRNKPHVVIVGGGFAGVKACKAFKGADVRVTLIDKRNFNLFQPLLYQVATGLVSRGDVATPLRLLVGAQRNVQVLLGEVTAIDADANEITFNGKTLSYDHLILATGSGSTFFGHEDWRSIAPPMKILEHAEEIRRRLLMALEEAERTVDAHQRRFLQTVVVVGSGPSGCELAGSVAELMRRALARDFRRVDPEQTRVVLVVSGGRVLKELPELLSQAAAANLRAKGIELVPGRVVAMQPGEVVIRRSEGEELIVQAANVFWTAGVRASKLGHRLAEATGCELDRGGRVLVEPNFSIPGYPEIRVVGDLCHYAHGNADGQAIPGMAGPATQMGQWVGRDLRAQLEGRHHRPFRYVDFGSMAVLGRLSAVANLRGIKLAGFPGWVLWALAHLAFMPDDENRITLLVKWLWAIVSEQRSSLLITGLPNDSHPGQGTAPFPMGWENEPSFADLLGPMAEAVEQFQHRQSQQASPDDVQQALSEC